jgi:3'-phosphoadenosine 5'-phosphosulfate sulfotransferase (PAPS reductase)/FAD synthetase
LKRETKDNPRHILGLSGGKDSTALAIYMKKSRPDIFDKLEFYFTDTGAELQELYDYLEKLEKYLSKPIFRIKATVDEKHKKLDIKLLTDMMILCHLTMYYTKNTMDFYHLQMRDIAHEI